MILSRRNLVVVPPPNIDKELRKKLSSGAKLFFKNRLEEIKSVTIVKIKITHLTVVDENNKAVGCTISNGKLICANREAVLTLQMPHRRSELFISLQDLEQDLENKSIRLKNANMLLDIKKQLESLDLSLDTAKIKALHNFVNKL